MPKIYTVSQVLAAPEGSYISAEIFAVLSDPKPPRGKGPWTAALSDSTGSIVGKFWGGDVSYWHGKRVRLHGQGMQRKGYNGIPELSVGQKAQIDFAGAPGTAAKEDEISGMEPTWSDSATAPQKPVQRVPVSPYTNPSPARQNAPTESGTPASHIHGATVGGALARAVDMWKEDYRQRIDKTINGEDFEQVEKYTRMLVGIQQRIESGQPNENEPPF